jgi:transposase
VPAVPSCILDPLREQFLALLPPHVDDHPLGCPRPRIEDAVVFGKLVQALVFGAGYERIADASCSATTMRRRRDDQMIGLDLADVCVDGCTTKAPCGGECAGRSPVDRGKGGLKRSQLTEGAGIPLATVSAPANTVDHALLAETLDALKDFAPLPADATVHLDAGYDYRPCREALEERGLRGEIAARGTPAPIQVGRRWVVERANSWLNDFRPAAPLHRTTPRLRRRLPRPGRGHRHHPCPAAGRVVALPLGHPATITTHPLTYWRTL